MKNHPSHKHTKNIKIFLVYARDKFGQTTYVRCRSISCGLI